MTVGHQDPVALQVPEWEEDWDPVVLGIRRLLPRQGVGERDQVVSVFFFHVFNLFPCVFDVGDGRS